jgi:hypothetical protein
MDGRGRSPVAATATDDNGRTIDAANADPPIAAMKLRRAIACPEQPQHP